MQVLDFLLTLLHLFIIGFNLFGWIWQSTRKFHCYLVITTAFCWVVPGYWYGIGYCPITDWQWQIKAKLGEQNLPNSFIEYMAEKVSGTDISSGLIDGLTGVSFGLVILITGILYVRGRKRYLNMN